MIQHSWFYSRGHVFAKLSFPTGKEKPPTYSKNIRLECFITGVSPNVKNVRFRFVSDPGFNYQRDNIYVLAKDEGTRRRPRARFDCVYPLKVRGYKGYWYTDYYNINTRINYRYESRDEFALARLHDEWVLEAEGPMSATLQFLLEPVKGRLKKQSNNPPPVADEQVESLDKKE